jgi:tetratricopeptide (TPR) repeat protein
MAILFHSMVDFNMHIPANAIVAVTLMAILSSCLRFASEKYWLTARLWVKVAATLVLGSGLAYLFRQETRRATEYTWLERAERAPAFSKTQVAAWEKAFAAEPGNFETAYAIGEAFRAQSWEGAEDYHEPALKAIQWFDRAAQSNPYHPASFLRWGMCLDWLGRPDEGQLKFDRAMQLDPNGYFTTALMGWHCVQQEDYAAAKVWFERSKRLQYDDNPITDSYLPVVMRKLTETATNSPASSALAL